MRLRSQIRSAAFVIVALLPGAPTAVLTEQNGRCRVVGSTARLPTVRESSGAALARRTPGVIWTHDDSGDPVIVALDTTGAVRARVRVRVAGARVVDWEDVAIGPCPTGFCLYVADIGDNAAVRREIVVYRTPEPLPQDRSTRQAEALRAIYPDGARDAEAIIVTAGDSLFVVTKGDNGPVALYQFSTPLRAGIATRLKKVATLATKVSKSQWITGASVSPDGRWVVLRTPASLLFYRAERLTKGVVTDPLVFDLRGLREPQGEGVALRSDGTVYLTGEGGGGGGARGRPGTFTAVRCQLPTK